MMRYNGLGFKPKICAKKTITKACVYHYFTYFCKRKFKKNKLFNTYEMASVHIAALIG